MKSKIRIGFVGYSQQKFDMEEAQDIIEGFFNDWNFKFEKTKLKLYQD